jgi:starch phosphorylase
VFNTAVPATTAHAPFAPGATDLAARAELLAERLSDGLKPLAPIAYNYVWSWMRDGEGVFRDINPHRWALSGANPVRFLSDLWPSTQEAAERNPELMERVGGLTEAVAGYVGRPDAPRDGIDGPIAFLCAEFGVHASLPIYSGGLGVLAGDMLKEASDQAFPMVGVGLFYRRGYFRQRIDLAGRQQEQWPASDPKGMPMARVTAPDGSPLRLTVPLDGHDTAFQVWRVDVGRVPLLLLDAELPENDPVQRWTTGRLYDFSRTIRLQQYGLLGIGGARLLEALAVAPAVVHLNEGHPALAPLELAAGRVAAGETLAAALAAVRERVVFTTHTPVPAGNETYAREELLGAFGGLAGRLGVGDEDFLDLFRSRPGDLDEPPGMSALALRVAGRANGVSRLHGRVAREMWRPLFGARAADEVPIGEVTNGVHVPTWVAPPMARVLERHLGPDWLLRRLDPDRWRAVRGIPGAELWEARCEARRQLVEFVRMKGEQDLLLRGEDPADVRALGYRIEPDVLTLGFARRLATYKRLHLLIHDVARTHRLLRGERKVQLLVAGKAHPADEGGKQTLQAIFNLRRRNGDALDRIAFVEDYDIDVARRLVAGCDVWINLPRRPFEASGTSGMKSALNGGLQLSVLDGWWAEGYDPAAGWAIPGDSCGSETEADAVDAGRFYDLLEHEVIPLFYDRGDDGVPEAWCERMRVSIASCAQAFAATRMLDDYVERMYARPVP